MERTTIDFGIDLGTTNSAIALLKGVVADVVKNNHDSDLTPSAVHIGKQGQIQVGARAKSRIEIAGSSEDVYVEFKRRMGSEFDYVFKSSGIHKSPEELSAEVLKSLKGDVQQRLGEEVQSAVITIPAAFEQRQCVATKKAGELAGFRQCPLLQEPVAASLAYGFQRDVTAKAFWLIFDFGGGTFDAAVMKAEDGDIHVVNHGGDNYLGGADIDLAIIERIIIPQLQKSYNLPEFKRGNPRWRAEFARVKRATEEAKILLSRSETAFLESCQFSDADGKLVEVDLKLTQNDVLGIAEPLIDRAVDICKRVLKEKNLGLTAIEKTLLVGGPTLAPWFRQILTDRLGIPLDFSVDPLTVVARGAAVFAGTQRIEKSVRTKAPDGQFDITLSYNPVGADEDPSVAGEISSSSNISLEGLTIEFVNRTTLWRSGKLPVNSEGKFRTRLLAEPGDKNIFDIEVVNGSGVRQKCVPAQLSYTIGMTVKAQTVCNDIAIALFDNRRTVLVKKGEPYPFKKTDRKFTTSVQLHKGSQDALRIPVVEGGHEMADCNIRLGELVLTGANIKRDLQVGSEIEITLKAVESGTIHVTAYIPVLDEEYTVKIDYLKTTPTVNELEKGLSKETQRLREQQRKSELGESFSKDALSKIETFRKLAVDRIATAGDPDSAKQAERAIIEMRCALDELESLAEWPTLVKETQAALSELEEMIDELGVDDQRKQFKELRVEVEQCVSLQQGDKLRKTKEKVDALNRDILFSQPAFWISMFKHLFEQREQMRNISEADRLFNQGYQFIQKNNIDGLRKIIVQLLQLLPQDIAAEIERGYQSGVIK
jgi:molecular chaperone DnaK